MPQQTVTMYEHLKEVTGAFAEGKFEFMLVSGSAGLSKSYTMRSKLGDRAHWITGNASPFQFYKDGWQFSVENQLAKSGVVKPGLLVIDDCDELLAQRVGLNLLKSYCQTDDEKLIGWNTASKQLKDEGIPKQYRFTGQVCVISNDYHATTRHLKAVIDRGLMVICKFSAAEVHRNVGSWWPQNKGGKNPFDREVFEFIGDHLHLIAEPSMRNYLVGAQARRGNLDWRAILFETFGLTEQHLVVHRIMNDPRLNGEERVREFERATGMSRATFFRIQGELKGLKVGVPIEKKKRPPSDEPPLSNAV